MDFQLMQWRRNQQQQQQGQGQEQHQSEHQQKHQVGLDRKQDQQQEEEEEEHHHQHQSPSALPLFLTEPVSKVGNNLSVLPDNISKFPKMMMTGGQFSTSQWQELELQAVIFRYMLAGASVPAELLQPIKNSLLNSSSFFLHHPLQHFPLYHYQPSSLQSGYWGRAGMDPEPGRCRRTDGKKWRCSRDVAPGHKYCERHMNRGRNRSRKPVESPKPGGGELCKTANPTMVSRPETASRARFNSFEGSSVNMPRLNHRSPFEPNDGGSSDGRVLRRFFDDWPRSMGEPGSGGINADLLGSSTSLSMSIRGGSSTTSDVSLKLSTGSGNEETHAERDGMQLNWMAQWGQHQTGTMGGPLAEALRSSASHD